MAEKQHSGLDTKFPVYLPYLPELRLSHDEFKNSIRSLSQRARSIPVRTKLSAVQSEQGKGGSFNNRRRSSSSGSSTGVSEATAPTNNDNTERSSFMDALLGSKSVAPTFDEKDGKMRTENNDVTYETSGQPLVDAFFELEEVISSNRLQRVLDRAWKDDPEATLKIIWNARSIHLGKSSRTTFYRAAGWLAQEHPATLLENLPWLARPLIPKKAPAATDDKSKDDIAHADEDEFELIEAESESRMGEPEQKKLKLDIDPSLAEFDIKYGIAHGYWKDLLNILALAANNKLKVDGNVRSILNVSPDEKRERLRDWTKGRKNERIQKRHNRVIGELKNNGFYKALHLSVARLFADQLAVDTALLNSIDKSDKKKISLAAKWAPSQKGMHDEHTCIVSSIAELLHPVESLGLDSSIDRATYLKHARISYQSKTLSPLRKFLQIVERPIAAQTFSEIKYERVPSLAMKQYTEIFAKKDFKRFDEYIEKVAAGKSRISGATLLPSTLVATLPSLSSLYRPAPSSQSTGRKALVEQKLQDMKLKVVDGQWKTLVQRIKDSGTLESSIAVCDVSGSMTSPRFRDSTCPMDSAIGLSLLLAEVTKPPFGGAFITFSQQPEIVKVGGADDERSFRDKVQYIRSSAWSMNTNFEAVFDKLILPLALEHKLKQEDMVKQVFVFSDMHFDSAATDGSRWATSFQRIQAKYKKAGYEMPRLIFWNLAGDSHGENDAAPKPVTATEEGTALVSGYSQGQMKMFLDNGSFDGEEKETEEEVETVDGKDDEVVVQKKSKEKKKEDPLSNVRKAIAHPAYRMLKVVD